MRRCLFTPKFHSIDFNPRTPYGMRPYSFYLPPLVKEFQSTHPLRDATKINFIPMPTSTDFNPRTPYGMRPDLDTQKTVIFLFQSTHPLRDATLHMSLSFRQQRFQSTHPLRDATKEMLDNQTTELISIHAPLTGCDKNVALRLSTV